MTLATELALYQELLPELLSSSEGRFAVIVGRDLVGTYETNDLAYAAGLARVGLKPFLLRQILRVRPKVWFPSISVAARD